MAWWNDGDWDGAGVENLIDVMFELCAAVNEREGLTARTKSTFYYTGSSTAKGDVSRAEFDGFPMHGYPVGFNALDGEGLVHSKMYANICRIRLGIEGLIGINASILYTSETINAFVQADRTKWSGGIAGLLGAGSYGSDWLPITEAQGRVQNFELWDQMREALDLLYVVVWFPLIGETSGERRKRTAGFPPVFLPDYQWDLVRADSPATYEGDDSSEMSDPSAIKVKIDNSIGWWFHTNGVNVNMILLDNRTAELQTGGICGDLLKCIVAMGTVVRTQNATGHYTFLWEEGEKEFTVDHGDAGTEYSEYDMETDWPVLGADRTVTLSVVTAEPETVPCNPPDDWPDYANDNASYLSTFMGVYWSIRCGFRIGDFEDDEAYEASNLAGYTRIYTDLASADLLTYWATID